MIKAGKWGDGDRGARKQFQSVVLQAVISQEAVSCGLQFLYSTDQPLLPAD